MACHAEFSMQVLGYVSANGIDFREIYMWRTLALARFCGKEGAEVTTNIWCKLAVVLTLPYVLPLFPLRRVLYAHIPYLLLRSLILF